MKKVGDLACILCVLTDSFILETLSCDRRNTPPKQDGRKGSVPMQSGMLDIIIGKVLLLVPWLDLPPLL